MPRSDYRQANLEKVRTANKTWAARNPEKCRAYAKRHRDKHRAERQAYKNQWIKKRPDETPREHQQRIFNATKHRKDRSALQVTDLTWPTHCPALGLELDYTGMDINTGWSIDKLVPSRGYVPGNVVIISRLANCIKCHATPAQIHQVATWLQGLRLEDSAE